MRVNLWLLFAALFWGQSFPAADIPGAKNSNPGLRQIKITFLGDSLTAGHGVAKTDAFPALIEAQLLAQGKNVQVTNSGISGSTTASGSSRLKWILRNQPDLVVIALGANDGLRGVAPEASEKNLNQVVALAKKNQLKVILCGMQLPINYGRKRRLEFAQIFPRIAKKHNIPLIPFLLEGVGGHRAYNLSDGVHPNEKGHKKIAQLVLPYIEQYL